MAILKTSNVVLIRDGVTHSLWSFDDSKEAEACYLESIWQMVPGAEIEFTVEDTEAVLDNGYIEWNNFTLCLIHSEEL